MPLVASGVTQRLYIPTSSSYQCSSKDNLQMAAIMVLVSLIFSILGFFLNIDLARRVHQRAQDINIFLLRAQKIGEEGFKELLMD